VDLSAPDRVVVQLDVFAEIGGVALSSSEVMGLIALAALIPLILFVIAYEYAQWRRKRILKVVSGPQ
jgi:pilus assembly protein TadC